MAINGVEWKGDPDTVRYIQALENKIRELEAQINRIGRVNVR